MNKSKGMTPVEFMIKFNDFLTSKNFDGLPYPFTMTARFDFPLEGANVTYDIVGIGKDGVLILYNPNCNRPVGHE